MRSTQSRPSRIAGAIGVACAFVTLGSASAFAADGASGNIPAAQMDAASKVTLAVMERHAEAMKTRDVDTIAADYSDDTIVLATLFPGQIIGKTALKKAIAEVLKIPPVAGTPDPTKFIRKEAVGEYGYQIFENSGLYGTETYVVRNGKIVFESATITLKDPPAK